MVLVLHHAVIRVIPDALEDAPQHAQVRASQNVSGDASNRVQHALVTVPVDVTEHVSNLVKDSV